MDVFSQEFKVPIKKNTKTQQTGVGLVISAGVIITSLLYMIYIIYQYFSGHLSPRVTQSTQMLTEKQYQFSYNPLLFSYDSLFTNYLEKTGFQGTKLEMKQKQQQFRAFNIFGLMIEYDQNTQKNIIKQAPITNCDISLYEQIKDDPAFYMCFDLDSNISLSSNSYGQDSTIFLVIGYCQMLTQILNLEEGFCHTIEFQKELMSEYDFHFSASLVIDSFDVQTEEKTQILQRVKFYPDFENVAYLELKLQETITQYDKNFLFSSLEEVKGINNVDIVQHTLSNEYAYERYKKLFSQTEPGNILAIVELKINLEEKLLKIEYVKFSEVIAMYLGICNTLMVLGIIGKLSSESVIAEELMESKLKHQYFLTAQNIQKQFPKRKNLVKSSNSLLSIANVTLKPFIKYKQKDKNKIQQSQNQNLVQVQPQQNDKDQNQKIINISNDTFKTNLSSSIQDTEVNKNLVFQILKKQIDENVNIVYIFEKIYKFEKMLRILFSEEQLSTLQFCGQRLPELIHNDDTELNTQKQNKKQLQQQQIDCSTNNQNDSQIKNCSFNNNLNYLEKQYLNENKESIIQHNFEQFMKRMQNNYQNSSEIDKRIYDTLAQKINTKDLNSHLKNQDQNISIDKKLIQKDEISIATQKNENTVPIESIKNNVSENQLII